MYNVDGCLGKTLGYCKVLVLLKHLVVGDNVLHDATVYVGHRI